MLHAPFKTVLQRQRQHANRRADGVSPADPIPERKRVLRIDAEFAHQLQVGRYRHHVFAHRLFP